ncbi:MAG: low molecular weight protein-tyrosine-phosphatase [Christensenellales bacterium]|jgi:protein-tyrosine phosphatase
MPVMKILFVCHGNICRSPMAEMVMKHMLRKRGLELYFRIDSAAATDEEIGNPVYPPAKRELARRGIPCEKRGAWQIQPSDYGKYDLIVGMDKENMGDMRRIFQGDPLGKCKKLLDFAGRRGQDVADPWYTGGFDRAYEDIEAGCIGILEKYKRDVRI